MKDLDWEGSSRNRIAWCISIKCRELVLEDEKKHKCKQDSPIRFFKSEDKGQDKGHVGVSV